MYVIELHVLGVTSISCSTYIDRQSITDDDECNDDDGDMIYMNVNVNVTVWVALSTTHSGTWCIE